MWSYKPKGRRKKDGLRQILLTALRVSTEGGKFFKHRFSDLTEAFLLFVCKIVIGETATLEQIF